MRHERCDGKVWETMRTRRCGEKGKQNTGGGGDGKRRVGIQKERGGQLGAVQGAKIGDCVPHTCGRWEAGKVKGRKVEGGEVERKGIKCGVIKERGRIRNVGVGRGMKIRRPKPS